MDGIRLCDLKSVAIDGCELCDRTFRTELLSDINAFSERLHQRCICSRTTGLAGLLRLWARIAVQSGPATYESFKTRVSSSHKFLSLIEHTPGKSKRRKTPLMKNNKQRITMIADYRQPTAADDEAASCCVADNSNDLMFGSPSLEGARANCL